MSSDYANPSERFLALQVIDVNVNRAAEGLRVVEEYCRFALGDSRLVARCKALRDQLHAAVRPISRTERLAARDTLHDVGAGIDFTSDFTEPSRAGVQATALQQIAIQNGERVKEALRVIEECCKPGYPEVAQAAGILRYQWYKLEQDIQGMAAVPVELKAAKLYVLIDGVSSECAFAEQVQALCEAGVHVLQLRDKKLDDRTLLERARLLRRIIDDHSPLTTHRPLFIINDRPDIAVLSGADGVHVGQEELSVRDVRRIVGGLLIVGVSTHSIEQARQAVQDGANYLGCGPTFPSATKHFDRFPGLEFLRQVAAEISLPAFAIGGITRENLPQVLAAGFTRVAVAGAIQRATDVELEVRAYLALLK